MQILSTIAGLLLIIVPGSGFFIAGRLLISKENRIANRTLAVLICAAAVEVLHVFTLESEHARMFFHYFLNLTHFLVPPLLLLYIRSALLLKQNLRRKDLLHLLPFFLCTLLYSGSIVIPPLIAGGPFNIKNFFAPEMPGNSLIITCSLIQFVLYFILALKDVYGYSILFHRTGTAEKAQHTGENSAPTQLPRFLSEPRACGKISSGASGENFIPPQAHKRLPAWLRLVSIFVLVIYAFAALDILLPRDFYFFSLIAICILILLTHAAISLFPPMFFASAALVPKYRNTLLPPALAAQYLDEIEKALSEEELFKDPSLTLESFGSHLNIPPHHISQVINANYAVNFPQHINNYRLRHAQQLLSRADGTMNILQIAYESGFNSKSSFNTIFKKTTGLSPREYRRAHEKKFQ